MRLLWVQEYVGSIPTVQTERKGTMKTPVEIAAKEHAIILVESLKAGGGSPLEADSALNRSAVRLIKSFHEGFGQAWLGKMNRTKEERREGPPLVKYDGGRIYCFGSDFVLRAHDAEVNRLMVEREVATYTNTRDDAKRIDAIIVRVAALGGRLVMWS